MKSKLPPDDNSKILKLDPKKRKKKIKGVDGVFTTVVHNEKNGQIEIHENPSRSSKKSIPDVPFLCQKKLTFFASAVAELILQISLQDRKDIIVDKLKNGKLNVYEILDDVVSVEVTGKSGMEKIFVTVDVKKLAEFAEDDNGGQ